MNLPPYQQYPRLANNRITLREISYKDLSDILTISYYDGVQAESIEAGFEILKKINFDYHKGDSIHWGIVDNETSKIVGTCGYYRGFKNSSGEIGCVLLHEYKKLGYMINALKLVVDFGIKEISLKRIWAKTSLENDKAFKLLNNLGFIKLQTLEDNNVEYEYLS
jgi:ribosomal-protein-alanine N-acetyltransferase